MASPVPAPMPRTVYLSVDPAAFDLHSLTPFAHEPPVLWQTFPVLSIRCLKEQMAAVAALPGVLRVYLPHSSLYGTYGNILTSFDKILQLPEEKRSELRTLNLSTSPPPGPYDEHEPMNIAIRAVADAGHTVVLAAGNAGPTENTLSPWSVAPWVIGVAAADIAGSSIWSGSSVGIPGDPVYRPTVAAPGKDVPLLTAPPEAFRLHHGTEVASVLFGFPADHTEKIGSGTSYAAPVVTRLCAYFNRFIYELSTTHHLLAELDRTGVIDITAAIRFSQMDPFTNFLHEFGATSLFANYDTRPPSIRALVMAAARPIPGCTPHQAGAGFVDDEVVAGFLKRFSALDFLRFFACTSDGAPAPPQQLKFTGPILPEAFIDKLIAAVREEMRGLDMPVLPSSPAASQPPSA